MANEMSNPLLNVSEADLEKKMAAFPEEIQLGLFFSILSISKSLPYGGAWSLVREDDSAEQKAMIDNLLKAKELVSGAGADAEKYQKYAAFLPDVYKLCNGYLLQYSVDVIQKIFSYLSGQELFQGNSLSAIESNRVDALQSCKTFLTKLFRFETVSDASKGLRGVKRVGNTFECTMAIYGLNADNRATYTEDNGRGAVREYSAFQIPATDFLKKCFLPLAMQNGLTVRLVTDKESIPISAFGTSGKEAFAKFVQSLTILPTSNGCLCTFVFDIPDMMARMRAMQPEFERLKANYDYIKDNPAAKGQAEELKASLTEMQKKLVGMKELMLELTKKG